MRYLSLLIILAGLYVYPQAGTRYGTIDGIRAHPNNYIVLGSEVHEQNIVLNYLPQDSVVLELGSRTGVVSRAINLVILDKGAHVAVDPTSDAEVLLGIQELQKECGFKFFNGALGRTPVKHDGYFHPNSAIYSASKERTVPTLTLSELQVQTNMRFNALVVDCEGCFLQVLQDFPELLDQAKYISVEYDSTPSSSVQLREMILSAKFQSVATRPGWDARLNLPGDIGFEVFLKSKESMGSSLHVPPRSSKKY